MDIPVPTEEEPEPQVDEARKAQEFALYEEFAKT